jgi:hypothetical protein
VAFLKQVKVSQAEKTPDRDSKAVGKLGSGLAAGWQNDRRQGCCKPRSKYWDTEGEVQMADSLLNQPGATENNKDWIG